MKHDSDTLDPAAPKRSGPIYLEIRRYIRDLIGGPDVAPGDRVPSERALAERLGANRMTVRRAIEGLVAEGLLERNGTSGTRVPLPRVTRPMDAHTSQGIARLVESGGGKPGNKLLHFEQAVADARLAARLSVAEGTELIISRRLWTVDATPFCIETSHIPASLIPGLAAEDLTAGQSLYALLRSRYGIATVAGERVIGVARCTDREAKLLHLPPGSAGLLMRLTAYDERRRLVEYMESLNHPDLVLFQTSKSGLPGDGAHGG